MILFPHSAIATATYVEAFFAGARAVVTTHGLIKACLALLAAEQRFAALAEMRDHDHHTMAHTTAPMNATMLMRKLHMSAHSS